MKTEQIDLSNPPQGATHYHTLDGQTPFRRKVLGVAQAYYSGAWHGVVGPAAEEFWEEIPKPWTGAGLPPVGSTVRIDATGRNIWDVAEQFVGVDVIIQAHFMSGKTPMVVVELLEIGQCICFRADMVRTAEQIAADERKAAIKEIRGLMSLAITGEYSYAAAIYDAGWRKPKE